MRKKVDSRIVIARNIARQCSTEAAINGTDYVTLRLYEEINASFLTVNQWRIAPFNRQKHLRGVKDEEQRTKFKPTNH